MSSNRILYIIGQRRAVQHVELPYDGKQEGYTMSIRNNAALNTIVMIGSNLDGAIDAIEYADKDEVLDDFVNQIGNLVQGKYALETPTSREFVPLKFMGITRSGDIVAAQDSEMSMIFTTVIGRCGVTAADNGIGLRQHLAPGADGSYRAVCEHNAVISHWAQIVLYVDLDNLYDDDAQ